MSETAEKSDPALWQRVKNEVTAGGKGGKPGQWSARKAQMAVAEYKKRGGEYRGERDSHNHLHEWTQEDWGTKSGDESGATGERYLPKAARDALTNEEYDRTTAAKRADTKAGHQHSAQPKDIAAKTARARDHRSKAALYAEAKTRDVSGRSTMSRDQLIDALR